MTRQRAISHLKDISMWGIVKADEYNALEMAIKALEQEPTKEEQALLKKWRDNRGIGIKEFEDALNVLQEPKTARVNRRNK